MANNNGGPWGGGGGNRPSGGKAQGQKPPKGKPEQQGENEFDRMIRNGQARIKRFVGNGGDGGDGSGGASNNRNNRFIVGLLIAAAILFWIFQSVHIVQQSDRALVMRFGKHVATWGDGPHFAPWPIYTVERVNVEQQITERIGVGNGPSGQDWSLMLTSDENIVDIEFEVVWRVGDPEAYRFNVENPVETIRAVAQSSIREVVARSNLTPLLNTDRGITESEVQRLIQENLEAYNTGVTIRRVNLTKSDPPVEVIADFKDVQAAEQERDTLSSQARATANQKLAGARGEEAQLLEDAEAYRARIVNQAEGDASRFLSVLTEYEKAPEVTRRRLYLETMERVYGQLNKIIVDEGSSEGVVPYLPINELGRQNTGNRAPASGNAENIGGN